MAVPRSRPARLYLWGWWHVGGYGGGFGEGRRPPGKSKQHARVGSSCVVNEYTGDCRSNHERGCHFIGLLVLRSEFSKAVLVGLPRLAHRLTSESISYYLSETHSSGEVAREIGYVCLNRMCERFCPKLQRRGLSLPTQRQA